MNNYIKKIEEYQSKISSKLNAILIREMAYECLGFELTEEQIVYLVQLLKQKRKKEQALEPADYFQIPVQYLFTLVTPFKAEEFTKRTSREYMASFTKNTIEPLAPIVTYTKYDKGYCRRFKMTDEFINKLDTYCT